MKNTKKSFLFSLLSIVLCCAMLLGTTFAWFTDTAGSKGNVIQAGDLDLELYWSESLLAADSADWKLVDEDPIFTYDDWEPGYTDVKYLKIENVGDLSYKWNLAIKKDGEMTKLADVIDVYYVNPVENALTSLDGLSTVGTLTSVIENKTTTGGVLLPDGKTDPRYTTGSVIIAIAMHMQENAGDEYQELSIGDGFTVEVVSGQFNYESDAFNNPDYDKDAQWPNNVTVSGNSATSSVTTDANGNVAANVNLQSTDGKIGATVPAGVTLDAGATSVTLNVKDVVDSQANVTLDETEAALSIDVHIDGVSATNTVVMPIMIKELLPVGLNMGNYRFYHVENGNTVEMTLLGDGATPVHNNYEYDPATGDVVLYLCSFSEFALVADTVNAWEGNFDYSWYTNAVAPVDGEAVTEYTIANADQLAAFGAIVGGMNGQTQDSFTGKTVKLLADINLGDKDNANENLVFYPIGYYNSTGSYKKISGDSVTSSVSSFEGTFDGNGNTIANFYQNTWEMFGDYNDGYSGTPNHYKDAMGLFGYVLNGTVKNLTVDNFSSDGEFTPTGVIAAYADGNSKFENIAITDCNPRVYNTGNGGIIGIAGDTSAANDDHITLKNITVDNSNKISALWGSWDVACGGLVGMYRGNVDGSGNATGDTISFENCHVSAIIDVYNDVCANYQYYAYRYSGMIIGSVRHNTKNTEGKTIPNMTGISATGCTVNYGDWNDYYYCEFEKNTMASYSEDYQFSRVPHSELDFTDSNENGVVDADERASVTGCTHTHTAEENHQAIYLPFHQLFTGYSWGVSSIGLEKYSGIVTNLDITEGDQEESVEKFETKFTGNFLYRVGNQNPVSIGSLFAAKDGVTISNAGVWVTIQKVDENTNVSGVFTANTLDWTKGTIKFSGTGVVKVTIQDYNYCIPTVLYLEVIDATNITSATGTTTGGDMVLLCDVNTTTYVNYWNCTLWGNGFTYSLKGAPTAYNSKQGHGILITKNAVLDNLVIVGDVYNSYGAYTNQDYYNTAIDVVGDTTIQNCYIANCAAPVKARSNVTIKNSTLYGGTVANLLIMSGTATLENVTTANYDDGRTMVGMGIVIHSDATETAKLVLNGTLTQYNFISESKVPTDTYAKNLHNAMFDSNCSQYQFGTSPNRYVNTGIISLISTFNGEDITDNAKTGYVGKSLTVSSYNGYVYTQLNTSGSVNNNCPEYKPTTQGSVPPSYSFDYTNKNYIAKTDGSNDYCYEENGKVNISMDEGDTFNWDTSILTLGKGITNYTVSMNGTDYTGKSIAFNTAGDYTVTYTYTNGNNYKLDENGNITTYSVTYTKTVNITVAVVKATTKHAEFTFGSSNTASTTVTIGNNTYVMPNVSGTSSTIGSTTVSGQTIYYPIVEIIMSDGKTSHSSGWYAYFPVFSGAVTITDYANNGTGDKMTPYNGSTTTKPSGLSTVGDPTQLFKYQSSSTAGASPVVKNNILVYSSPSISAKRSEYNTVVQYSYTDNAGATYYYYIGYHAPAQSYSSCITPDTLVTLADRTQVRVDSLTGNEELLVWNHETGKLDKAPVAYIVDHEGIVSEREVIHMSFANGKTVKIIGEHIFFDATLNKYVAIDAENVENFIGHTFVALGTDGTTVEKVELISVAREIVETMTYEVVTYKHLTCFTEGILSTSAFLDPLLNVFDVNEDTLAYDPESVKADVEAYGLYTYEDFDGLISEDAFELYNAAYLKIAVGKGYITWDDILDLIDIYFAVDVQPIQ